ncbi:hypothetical protein EVAR_81561_1 [Eumeta japonica]|uniref:Uncharacterized protein n=1 Tax=Eumeta variegata TaxID=151549 RepID=A0A4C1UZB0_EUMVA|nr:hypothetical protein EVAR_81561_1 [Eumeta japonica]
MTRRRGSKSRNEVRHPRPQRVLPHSTEKNVRLRGMQCNERRHLDNRFQFRNGKRICMRNTGTRRATGTAKVTRHDLDVGPTLDSDFGLALDSVSGVDINTGFVTFKRMKQRAKVRSTLRRRKKAKNVNLPIKWVKTRATLEEHDESPPSLPNTVSNARTKNERYPEICIEYPYSDASRWLEASYGSDALFLAWKKNYYRSCCYLSGAEQYRIQCTFSEFGTAAARASAYEVHRYPRYKDRGTMGPLRFPRASPPRPLANVPARACGQLKPPRRAPARSTVERPKRR